MAENRVTTVYLEAMRDAAAANARVTTIYVEVLRTTADQDIVLVEPTTGELEIEGGVPTIVLGPITTKPSAGELEIEGLVPTIRIPFVVAVPGGELEIEGFAPTIGGPITTRPETGELEIEGFAPFVEPYAIASQAAVLVMGEIVPQARTTQAALLVIGEIIPPMRVTQAVLLILADAAPCVSRRCDVWTITRRDGTVFGFTSHDEDVTWRGVVHKACASLTPTATEQSSSLADIGNIDLQGLIDSDEISEEDLYGGRFDDAFVEVWRIPWDTDYPDISVRLAAGWVGTVKHGVNSFSMEVLGPGTRMSQQPLVETVTPGCRWVFGDPTTCQFDRDALLQLGNVTARSNRGEFVIDTPDPGGTTQWANGLITWTYGVNAGTSQEVKSVNFTTGAVELWTPTPFLPEIGDQFELLPGCDRTKAQCQLYSNFINFGGFPDIPGSDAIQEAPDAKY